MGSGLEYKYGSLKFANNFDVTTTRPLDIRLVVKSVDDLYNGSIEAPYKGMVVNIAGTEDMYVYTATYRDSKGVLHEGIEGAGYKQNWSKISYDVVEFQEGVFRDDNYSNGGVQTFQEQMTTRFGNPKNGILAHVNNRNSDRGTLYILIDAERYDKPEGWMRIGGVAEKYSIPVMTDGMRTEATGNRHNDFHNDGKSGTNGDIWIKVDTDKSRRSMSRFGGVEMVSTDMIEDNTLGIQTQFSTMIDNEVGILNIRIDDEVDGLQKRIDREVDGLQTIINNEVDGLQTRMTGVQGYLDNKIDSNTDGIQTQFTVRINGVQEYFDDKINNSSSGIQDQLKDGLQTLKQQLLGTQEIVGTIDTIMEISTWIGNHTTEYNSLVNIHNAGIKGVQEQISSLDNDVNGKITNLTDKHNGDIKGVQEQISTEADTRSSADNTLTTNLNKEIQDRTTAITNLTTSHGNDIKGVQEQISSLDIAVDEKITNLTYKFNEDIKGVQEQIVNNGGLSGDITTINNDLAAAIKRIEELEKQVKSLMTPDVPTAQFDYGGTQYQIKLIPKA